jgi:hypothetical protein
MSRRCLPLSLMAIALTVGCFGSKRENSDCNWPAHASTRLNLARESDRTHLTTDVLRAEELAIRYGDVRWGPGAIRQERSRQDCLEPLFARVAAEHGINRADINSARDSLSHRGLNLTTNIPIALFFLGASALLLLMIARRFSPQEELLPFALAALLASGFVGIVTVGVGGIFEGTIEMFRVGNDHLGYRGLRLQWVRHRPELLAAAIVLFWVIAAGYAVLPASDARPGTRHRSGTSSSR